MTVQLREFSLSLAAPLATGAGDIRERRGLLVGVRIDGARGVGEATPLPGWTEPYAACRERLRSATAIGPDDLDADHPAARHGVELAHLDAEARRANVPLAAVLSDDYADRVPVNATVGDATPEATVAAATAAVDREFDCLKVKVGARDLAADLDRLRAVREAVADGVTLRVDANGAWNRETAESALPALAELGVEMVEQPLPAAALDDLAELRGHGVDVAVDESLAHSDLDEVLAADAADVVVVKPMVLGGPRHAVSLADRARSVGVDVVVTTTVDAAVARAAAVHVAACVPDVRPCGLATGALLSDDLGPDPVPVTDGSVRRPDGPGNCGGVFDDLLWG